VREAIIGEAQAFEKCSALIYGDLEAASATMRQCHHAEGFQAAFSRLRGWLARVSDRRIWRTRPAGDAEPGCHRIPERGQHAFSMYAADHGTARMVHGAEQKKMFVRNVAASDRHHELTERNAAPIGLLRTKAAKQADAVTRSRHQIFIRRRACLADNIIHLAGAHRRRSRGIKAFAVWCPSSRQCRRLAGRPQRRVLRLDRAQDGIQAIRPA